MKHQTLQELFSSPERWTKGAYARNKNGDSITERNKSAVSWCLVGGLFLCYKGKKNYFKIDAKLTNALPDGVSTWNDDPQRTFSDIQKLVKKLGI